MAIASDPSVKPQKIETEEEKMLTTTIFKSIHPRLRVVYINQKDLLKMDTNCGKLWKSDFKHLINRNKTWRNF